MRLWATAAAMALIGTASAHAQELPPSGPMGAVMEYDPGHMPAVTVYRPRDMGSARDLPILVWGNGACLADGGAPARRLLMELASYGYVILAPGKPGPDTQLTPVAKGGPPPRLPPVQPGDDETQASELTRALDWAVAETGRPGSVYRDRLATKKIGVMGHSCGGLQAISIQADPRIRSTIIWNSGVYDRPPGRIGVRPTKAVLATIHAPILYAEGGPTDIAYEPVKDDYARLPPRIPAVLVESNLGHSGSLRQQRGGTYARIARAWFGYWLKGERQGLRMFAGPDCGLCRDPEWKVSTRALP